MRVGVPAAAVAVVATTLAAINPAAPAPPVTAGPAASVAPARASAPTSTPAPGFRLVADNRAARAASAASLRKALNAAVRRTAPGATWLAEGDPADATPDGQPPQITGDGMRRTQDQMFAGGTLGKCGTGPKDFTPETLLECRPSAEECTASKGPDGRRQRVRTTTSLHGFVSHEATVELADQRLLMIFVDNEFVGPGTDPENPVVQPEAPLSPAQVGAVATAIGAQIRP